MELAAELRQLSQFVNLGLDVDAVNMPVVQGIDNAFCEAYRPQDQHLVFVVHVDMEAPSGVNSPVPLSLALENARLLDLTLEFDDQMLEQVRNLSGARFLPEGVPVVIVAAMLRKVGEKLKEQARDMRSMLRRIPVGVRHFDDKFHPISVVEQNLNDLQREKSLQID